MTADFAGCNKSTVSSLVIAGILITFGLIQYDAVVPWYITAAQAAEKNMLSPLVGRESQVVRLGAVLLLKYRVLLLLQHHARRFACKENRSVTSYCWLDNPHVGV